MRRLAAITFALLLDAHFAVADVVMRRPVHPLQICEQILCRTPTIRLYIDATHTFQNSFVLPVPVLSNDGGVTAFPGETLFIEAQLEEGKWGKWLRLIRAVASNQSPERTLVVKFSQVKGQRDMLLEVSNPFPVDIKFNMAFSSAESSELSFRWSCPLRAGLNLVERWNFPVTSLHFSDVRVLAPSHTNVCQ